ncbi:early light-induced protein 1, chloroplastic [Oryza sativa Japonica Group]|uniref:Early light-induced protein, low molecular weight n=1 Tax=Oryza sativa subsp. japonica TaxID=39947 RepID=Q6ETX9_ORYSJ|nr:high molecular mass early light-inducible protein HV58, chloroplastic [Oryza sativa Japonica Group]BAD27891.1 putative early light-induced protein, low molecular weight [Oryza sativa Japonica Group]
MAAATMALSSSFAAAAAGGAPWRGVVGAGRAAVGFPPRRRAVALVVRAQTEPDVEPTKEETTTSSTPTPTPSPAAAAPKAKPAASTGLWDVLAFSGPAPEPINGRLAMVGFVSALAVEASRSGELLEEASSGGGLAWFAATAAVRPSRPPRRRFRVPRRRCLCPTPRARGRLLVVAAAAASVSASRAAARNRLHLSPRRGVPARRGRGRHRRLVPRRRSRRVRVTRCRLRRRIPRLRRQR